LRRLVVSHPEANALRDDLTLKDARVVFEPGPPGLRAGLRAEFDTPHGKRVLQ